MRGFGVWLQNSSPRRATERWEEDVSLAVEAPLTSAVEFLLLTSCFSFNTEFRCQHFWEADHYKASHLAHHLNTQRLH